MSSVNKVILLGRLGGDPEVKYTQGGTAVARFSVATSDRWTDKQSGEKQEKTEWHRVVIWGKLAEICGEYLKKGAQVYLEGRNDTTKYTDKQGIERYSTDVVCSVMNMIGGKQDGQAGGNGGGQQRAQGQQGGSRQASPARQQQGFDDDDSIPF